MVIVLRILLLQRFSGTKNLDKPRQTVEQNQELVSHVASKKSLEQL